MINGSWFMIHDSKFMNAKMSKLLASVLVIVIVFVNFSCDRRDIYEEEESPVKVIVNTNWSELGSVPEGATIMFYPESGKAPYTFKTNSVSRSLVSVPSGYYTVLVFNRTVDEFGTLSFHGMDALGTAGITLLDKKVSWIDTRQDTIGRVVYEPEAIVVGRTDHFHVRSLPDRIYNLHSTTRADFDDMDVDYDSVDVYEKKMLYTAYISVRVKGINNIKSIRGYINGMAGGAYLATRSASDSLGTYTLESWTLNRDATDYSTGTVNTNFECLGLPEQYLQNRQADNEKLLIRFLLVDNQTVVTRTFDVGDLIYQNDDELLLDLNLDMGTEDPLPDVKPEGGSESGFDITIEDWGDTINVVVPL